MMLATVDRTEMNRKISNQDGGMYPSRGTKWHIPSHDDPGRPICNRPVILNDDQQRYGDPGTPPDRDICLACWPRR